MDKRVHHSTPRGRGRGRGSYWCQAGGAMENSSREFPNGSNDDMSSYQSRTSQPMPFYKSSNKFSHVKKPKHQFWQVRKSPISSGGEDLNLVNDVGPVTDAVTPPLKTCYNAPISHSLSNLRDKRLEPLGPGWDRMVDDGEKVGDFLPFGPSSTGSSAHSHGSAAAANSISEISSANKDDVSFYGNQNSNARSVGNCSKQFCNSSGSKGIASGVEKLNLVDEVGIPISAKKYLCASVSSYEKDYPSNFREKSLGTWIPHETEKVDSDAKSDGSFFSSSNIKDTLFKGKVQCSEISQKEIEDSGRFDSLNCRSSRDAFDICPSGSFLKMLKPSLLEQNKIKRAEAKRSMEGQKIIELRSGMILLKKYISLNNQVKIVEECRDLGLGPGGFYEPGYRDGGKLHLKMMCLGKNWDPQKREYGDKRDFDDAKPPLIPNEFHQLVKGAIEVSHSFLKERSKSFNVGRVLPSMSPNICIVNFYTKSGRLGLHQDKDESQESIDRMLPVVSFSIGDSAEFLYSDQRDPEKADKVVLESGDVLIFGGKSRLVFHGVTSIKSETAPKALLEEARLRPGRLNLTFREG